MAVKQIPHPIRAVFFDIDGPLVKHPEPGHDRIDHQRVALLIDRAAEYQKIFFDEERLSFDDRLYVSWSSRDPYNLASTDLSFVLHMMSGNMDPNILSNDPKLIHKALEIIRNVDFEIKHKLRLNDETSKFEYFEYDPELIKIIGAIKEASPRAGFFPNSGNSQYMTNLKLGEIGMRKIMTMDKLPKDPPIYGEHIQQRSEGVEWILNNAKGIPKEGATVLFCDRLADAAALDCIPPARSDSSYFVYFGDDPFANLSPALEYHMKGRSHPFALQSAHRDGRVLYLPDTLPIGEKVEKLRDFFSLPQHRSPEAMTMRRVGERR